LPWQRRERRRQYRVDPPPEPAATPREGDGGDDREHPEQIKGCPRSTQPTHRRRLHAAGETSTTTPARGAALAAAIGLAPSSPQRIPLTSPGDRPPDHLQRLGPPPPRRGRRKWRRTFVASGGRAGGAMGAPPGGNLGAPRERSGGVRFRGDACIPSLNTREENQGSPYVACSKSEMQLSNLVLFLPFLGFHFFART
jgi:hypothetical protein